MADRNIDDVKAAAAAAGLSDEARYLAGLYAQAIALGRLLSIYARQEPKLGEVAAETIGDLLEFACAAANVDPHAVMEWGAKLHDAAHVDVQAGRDVSHLH